MSDRRKLQELFERYDASGDGVLSEDEMLDLFEHLGLSRSKAKEVFNEADANKDGNIQVHEFLSWITGRQASFSPLLHLDEHGSGKLEFVIGNPTKHTMKYIFKFHMCENVECYQNPVQVVLEPGKRIFHPVLRILSSPFSYDVSPVCFRAEVNNGKDAGVEDAFKDPDFPHDESSLKNSRFPEFDLGKPDLWVRARMLGDSSDAVLFDQVRPQDVQQGRVGDCYVLATLGALAQQPQRLKSLFGEKYMTPDGKYTVKLYHLDKKEWVKVTVDEFVPCMSQNGMLEPACARPLGEEIWVPLLEKAIAKFVGGYGELYGGVECWVFNLLTGENPEVLHKTKDGWVSYMSRGMKARDPRSGRPKKNKKEAINNEELFQYLSGALADKHILTCSINFMDYKPIDAAGMSQVRMDYGLEANHAYSLLKCFEEKMDNGQPIRLVQIRNPWGFAEWKGDWADYSKDTLPDCWEKNPDLKARLKVKNKNDGLFYMAFDDFVKIYSACQLCPVGTKPLPNNEELEDDMGEEEKGFFGKMFGSWW